MPHQLTLTAIKTGPDKANTITLQNVSRVDFDLNDKVVQVYQDGAGGSVKEYDLAGVAAVTVAITAGNWVVTLA